MSTRLIRDPQAPSSRLWARDAQGDRVLLAHPSERRAMDGRCCTTPSCYGGVAGWKGVPRAQIFSSESVIIFFVAFQFVSLAETAVQSNVCCCGEARLES